MILSLLKDNPYFGAGFGLFAVGICAATARRVGRLSLIVLRRRYISTLELTSNDRCFNWVLDHVSTHFGPRGPNHLAIGTASEAGDVLLVPSVGQHLITYKHKWIRIERKREKVTNLNTGSLFETLTLSTIGDSRELFVDFINDSIRKGIALQRNKVIVYTPYGSLKGLIARPSTTLPFIVNEWRQFGAAKSKRPLGSVVLEDGVSDLLLKDVNEFLGSGPWYAERGIPYRRGYLLHGPPGCGKSSFIYALAGTLRHSICLLNLSDGTMTDERMNLLLNSTPGNSIILLEDIDAATADRRDCGRFEGMNLLTLSGLLNALDGVASSEGRLVFMTTNHIDRVDHKQYIGLATDSQLRNMFRRFYSNCTSFESNAFLDAIKSQLNHGNDMSPAEVQALLMLFKDKPGALINHLKKDISRIK